MVPNDMIDMICLFVGMFQRACRAQVSDLVNSVHSLYTETQLFIADKSRTSVSVHCLLTDRYRDRDRQTQTDRHQFKRHDITVLRSLMLIY